MNVLLDNFYLFTERTCEGIEKKELMQRWGNVQRRTWKGKEKESRSMQGWEGSAEEKRAEAFRRGKGKGTGEGGEGRRRDVSRRQEREQSRDREGEGRNIISKLNKQI